MHSRAHTERSMSRRVDMGQASGTETAMTTMLMHCDGVNGVTERFSTGAVTIGPPTPSSRTAPPKGWKALIDAYSKLDRYALGFLGSDPTKLDERLEEILDDQQQQDLFSAVRASTPADALGALVDIDGNVKSVHRQLANAISAAKMNVLCKLTNAVFKTCMAATLQCAIKTPEPQVPASPLGMPPEVLRAIHGQDIAWICLSALRAAEKARPLDKSIMAALANKAIDGHKAFLAFYADMFGIFVPTSMLPISERINVQDVYKRHVAADNGYAFALEESRKTGKPFPPVAEDG